MQATKEAQLNNATPFRIGQHVKLKSGGPTMTVIGISHNGRIWCEWQQTDGYVDEGSFVPETLTKV